MSEAEVIALQADAGMRTAGPAPDLFDADSPLAMDGAAESRQARHHAVMQRFVDDDTGYLDWISRNPGGFVVNTYRNPSPVYLVLHRSACRTINGVPARGRQWTADFIKVCGDQAELESWASTHVGGQLRPCRLCL